MPYSGMEVRSYGKPYPRVHHVRDASWCGSLLAEGPEQCEVLWDGSYGPDCELTRDIVKQGVAFVQQAKAAAATLRAKLDILDALDAKPKERKPLPDDLADRLKGYSIPELKAFAVLNGVWDAKYATMPNPGLVRMNVVNRLRAKLRKGHKVKWNG